MRKYHEKYTTYIQKNSDIPLFTGIKPFLKSTLNLSQIFQLTPVSGVKLKRILLSVLMICGQVLAIMSTFQIASKFIRKNIGSALLSSLKTSLKQANTAKIFARTPKLSAFLRTMAIISVTK